MIAIALPHCNWISFPLAFSFFLNYPPPTALLSAEPDPSIWGTIGTFRLATWNEIYQLARTLHGSRTLLIVVSCYFVALACYMSFEKYVWPSRNSLFVCLAVGICTFSRGTRRDRPISHKTKHSMRAFRTSWAGKWWHPLTLMFVYETHFTSQLPSNWCPMFFLFQSATHTLSSSGAYMRLKFACHLCP